MAYLETIITNIAIGVHGKKGTEAKKLTDFLIDWDPEGKPEKKQSPEEMLAIFKNIAVSQKVLLERQKKIEERKKKSEERKKSQDVKKQEIKRSKNISHGS